LVGCGFDFVEFETDIPLDYFLDFKHLHSYHEGEMKLHSVDDFGDPTQASFALFENHFGIYLEFGDGYYVGDLVCHITFVQSLLHLGTLYEIAANWKHFECVSVSLPLGT